MILRKSLIMNEKQFDISVQRISGPSIVFSIGNDQHEMTMKSRNNEGINFELDGKWSSASVSRGYSFEDIVCIEGLEFKLRPLDYLPIQPWLTDHNEKGHSGEHVLKSPLHGKISEIFVSAGSDIKKGDLIYSLDAMKIENKVTSPYSGNVKEIRVKTGDQVAINQIILVIES